MHIIPIELRFELKCRLKFNRLVMSPSLEIGRLIGFFEGEEDFYEIVQYPDGIRYESMVGDCVSLKRMGKYIYNLAELQLKIPKADKFIKKVGH